MKKVLILIFSLMCAFTAAGADEKGEVKLISFNIRTAWGRDGSNSWEYRRIATKALIEAEKPDVIGLQEAMGCQLDYIDRLFPEYGRAGIDRDGGMEGAETMAIYYRKDRFELPDSGTFWLSESPEMVSKGWDAACNRTVTWVRLLDGESGKDFFYFNTHLDHQGRRARQESVLLILDRIREIAGKKSQVILGGDMNSAIDSPIFKPLLKFMKSARERAKVTDHSGTFNGFGSAPDNIILDHLFYRGKIRGLRFRTLNGDYGAPFISDHYPIEITFRL